MYLEGNVILVEGSFRDRRRKLFDPQNISFHYTGPGGIEGMVDEEDIEHIRQGQYEASVQLTAPGIWHFQWRCSGVATGYGELSVKVEPRKIA